MTSDEDTKRKLWAVFWALSTVIETLITFLPRSVSAPIEMRLTDMKTVFKPKAKEDGA